jgi:hypothetical protein
MGEIAQSRAFSRLIKIRCIFLFLCFLLDYIEDVLRLSCDVSTRLKLNEIIFGLKKFLFVVKIGMDKAYKIVYKYFADFYVDIFFSIYFILGICGFEKT